jgi:RecB family exonuclease
MESRGEGVVSWAGRDVRVRCEVLRPDRCDELLPEADRRPAAPETHPVDLDALGAPALAAVPLPAALPVSRLSYSGLESYARCGYRFYLDRVLRLPQSDDPADPAIESADALHPLMRGSLAHRLLEGVDLTDPVSPDAAAVRAAIEAAGEPVRDEEVADLLGMVSGFLASELAGRIARAQSVRAELPFAYTLSVGGRELVMNGIVDVHATEPEGVLVVDYKTNVLDGLTPAEVTEESYATQRLVYALAALRGGAARAEVAYVYLERPDEPVGAVYTQADAPALEAQLTALAQGVAGGRFEPTLAPHRRLCWDCPGRKALCRWGPELTLADEPPAEPLSVLSGA